MKKLMTILTMPLMLIALVIGLTYVNASRLLRTDDDVA